MSSNTLSSPGQAQFSIEMLREEVLYLLACGAIHRQQPLYILCQYIPAREWGAIEDELEKQGYLLRDPISDLIGAEVWQND
jgi:hypothetical protein